MRTGIVIGQRQEPTLANGGIANGIIGYWPGFQASGDTTLLDRSGKGAHSGTLWSSTTPWGTANYFTSDATAGHFAKIPLAKWPQRFTTDCLLIFLNAILTKTGGSQYFMGNGVDTTHTGFGFGISSAGAIFWASYKSSGSEFEGNSTETPWDTAVLASAAAAYDPVESTLRLYVNGVRCANYVTPSGLVTPGLMDTAITNDIGIGGRASGAQIAGNVKTVHAYYRAGALPVSIDAIVNRLHHFPTVPLSAAEWDGQP